MTTEQIITFATPIALIIATIIQKYDARKATRQREESEAKVIDHADEVEARVTKRAQEVADKVEARVSKRAQAVQDQLEENNRQRNRQLTTIHTLVNSGMSEQKRINMLLAKRVAKMTGDPLDLKVAEDAERIYMEHEAKQAVVDRFYSQETDNEAKTQATLLDWDQPTAKKIREAKTSTETGAATKEILETLEKR
jgi:hypothetical protein